MPGNIENDRGFLHIPKTGGQSFAQLMERSTTQTMQMHIPSSCLLEPVKLLSVIRDPVDRIYSLFRYTNAFDFDLFLADIADPLQWEPEERRSKNPCVSRSSRRLEAGGAQDPFIRQLDQLNVDWFITGNTPPLWTTMQGCGIPGHVVANQWDYIENTVGHDIKLISFEEMKKLSELPSRNIGKYSKEEKESELTPERIARIKELCHKDYENLSAYF